jgi:acetolactate synthase-1/2/3 large subunit
MNGADAVIATLADNGVEVCFANPGTSEMHLVSALGREPRMRPVLALFEGVCSGAADGYARMAGKPAATLLHLGPGLANAAANLHNARRAGSPVVNIVGDHPAEHGRLDPPLASDIETLARPTSLWVETARTAAHAARLTAEAVAASQGPPGGPATLVLPADCAWSPADGAGPRLAPRGRPQADGGGVEAAAQAVRAARRPALLAGGSVCGERGIAALGRLQAAGLRVLTDTFVARQARGAGRFAPKRLNYFAEMALADLEGCDLLLLAETRAPVAMFAYPDKPSVLLPDGCRTVALAEPHEDGVDALEALAEALGAPASGPVVERHVPERPGPVPLDAFAVGDALARHLPAGAVVVDEAITAGPFLHQRSEGAAPHDWLSHVGGAIGQGVPVAIGAAIAAPGRKVVALVGDGSAAYTLQGLWTLAREGLDVVVVVLANHSYRILEFELMRTGAGDPGKDGRRLLSLEGPRIDWMALSASLGVPAVRCADAASFDAAFARDMAEHGPRLIEAAL